MTKKEITAIDIDFEKVESGGVAYYRIDKYFKEFLSKCNKDNGIIGFQFEDDSSNFGVILAKKEEHPAVLGISVGDTGTPKDVFGG